MNDLVVSEGHGSTALTSHRAATDAAGVCRELVTRTAQSIQGRKYVRVEGWQAIANSFGCVASATDVRVVDGGIAATGQVRRVSDGAVLATAEGFVGVDEKTWANRPEFARRAMAQTRAISRACRSAFAFVVVMIDENLQTTPAEEMEHLHEPVRVEYRPRPAPENLEKRPGRVRLKEPAAAPADTPAQKARVAISKARTIPEIEGLRSLLDTRLADGSFDAHAHAELVGVLEAQREFIATVVREEGGAQ